MGTTWLCQREGCGHNKSEHRMEIDRFRGGWNTSCRAEEWGYTGRDRCRCGEFMTVEAAAELAAVAARAEMVCSCGHHVDEHYWSPGGELQGTCHHSEHGEHPICACSEYDGPEQVEAATTKKESV